MERPRRMPAIADRFTDDYRNDTPLHPARSFTGREQVRDNWTQIFGGVPDIQIRLMRSAAEGDSAWAEWKFTGTRRDGTPHLMRGVTVFGLRDGRAAWSRFYVEPVDDDATRVQEHIRRKMAETDAGNRMRPLAVIRCTGRRSGRRRDIPVGLHEIDGVPTVFTDRPWRLNFRGGADVTVMKAGRTWVGRGELVDDPDQVGPALAAAVEQAGARNLGLAITKGAQPTTADFASLGKPRTCRSRCTRRRRMPEEYFDEASRAWSRFRWPTHYFRDRGRCRGPRGM